MSHINPFLLLILPVIFQLLFGRKSMYEKIKLSFFKVSLISFLSQLLASYFALEIATENLRKASGGQIRCGMPLLGMITLEFFLLIILLIIILIQYFVKRRHERADEQL